MTIGELAHQCGVSRDALRFYEREGLLTPPRRSPAGYRLYGETDVARLQFIRRGQATGLTLDDIRELLRVQQLQGHDACLKVAARLRDRMNVIDRKIAELRAFRGDLARGLAMCESSTESCPVVLDFAAGRPATPGRGVAAAAKLRPMALRRR